MPQRLTKIDDLTRPDHWYLTAEDDCYFLGEYTARKGYAFSATNNLVFNFKKPISARGQAQWRYKEQAINQAALGFRTALNNEWLNVATLVPIPPSKSKTDPLYDGRLIQMLQAIRANPVLDIRELIIQTVSTGAAHELERRPRPEDIEQIYTIDDARLAPTPSVIGVFDDVLTTGAHFTAAKSILSRSLPGIRIIGLFIARRVPDASDIEEFMVE